MDVSSFLNAKTINCDNRSGDIDRLVGLRIRVRVENEFSQTAVEIPIVTAPDILSWINSNKLLLNPSKTEFLLIGTKQQRLEFSQPTTLSLGNDIIPVSSSARNIGFIFDSDMSFTDQININSLSKSCHFHIRDIRRIRHLLPLSAATVLANSLISSKLV